MIIKRKFHTVLDEEEVGVSWLRGPLLGKGGYASVYLAETYTFRTCCLPELIAVKSAEVSKSTSLQREKEILYTLHSCPYVIDCYGEEITTTNKGHSIYNLLLEFASGGTLDSLIKKSDGGLPYSDVRRFTRFLLKGIDFIHRLGYVHCDLKPANVLFVFDKNSGYFVPKIGDFGVAKRYEKMKSDATIRGTTLYMAPETVIDRIQESPSDIWALGCIVFEMLTGNKIWNPNLGMRKDEILKKISNKRELPKIPPNVSEEGKQFLKACLARNPKSRYTAERLLSHPFVSGSDDLV